MFQDAVHIALRGTMDPALTTGVPPAEAFTHVRIIIGIILGLCVSRLLTGFARFIQHPASRKSTRFIWAGWLSFCFPSSISGGSSLACAPFRYGRSRNISSSFSMPGFISCSARCSFPTAWKNIPAIAIISSRGENGSSAFSRWFTSLMSSIR